MTRALPALVLAASLLGAGRLAAQNERIGDLTSHAGDVPVRFIGYGLVVGLEGTGDRSFGEVNGATQTVRSVANALRRFGVEVPAERLRPRNVAAVLVTAESSPYLRAGGRFEVQVSSLGDATSLRGGVLWITPLMTDVGQPIVATAQGPLLLLEEEPTRSAGRRGTSARIPEGGVLEVDPPAVTAIAPRLILRRPDLGTANRIAQAVNGAFGEGSAKVEDPGAIALTPKQQTADNLLGFLAAVDTLPVRSGEPAKIIIDSHSGTVVAGGDLRVGAAAVSHRGLTLRIGGPGASAPAAAPAPGDSTKGVPGLLSVAAGATVQEVVAGLHAAGARPQEIAALFDALQQVGALTARVVIR
jgi:flagellar P-ring protein precursor FlgI